MKVDVYQYFWCLVDCQGQWFLMFLVVIYCDFGFVDLVLYLQVVGVDVIVLVQFLFSVEDICWMLLVVVEIFWVCGVVGWVDFKVFDVVQQIEDLVFDFLFKGLWFMLQDLFDNDWIVDLVSDVVVEVM